jgi:hypothetical protein
VQNFSEVLGLRGRSESRGRCAIPVDLPNGRAEIISLGIKKNPASALQTQEELNEYIPPMKTHGLVVGAVALGFTMVSPQIGPFVELLGARLVG